MTTAQDITWSLGPKPQEKQLLVDISELVNRDAKTGIQRVVRSILRELLLHPPTGYRVEPIFANSQGTYGYARRFTIDFLGLDGLHLQDEEVDFFAGDFLLNLDLSSHTVIAREKFHQKIRNMGVKMGVVVYDLLPISMPWAFPDELYCIHDRWLQSISEAHAVYCISQTVANEFKAWLSQERPDRVGKIEVSHFHLGADIAASVPTTGLPPDSHSTLQKLKATPSFVLVGTVEPRKGHRQILQAFELLWSQGVAANLVIVGKAGWNVDDLVQDLRSHPCLGSKLFWLSGISDEYLALIYEACCCLLAPSEGEGFGLPLIEAAHYNLPIIARDLPVFREVAGDDAQYFSGLSPNALAQSIVQWLDSQKERGKVHANHFGCLSWRDSTGQLLKIMGL
jgi:glycosyltransferase involved in cell wall biosynthesis